jgi:DNA polymerase I-like protein with 3'-5' exonuclease and polymerase domains
VELPFSLSLFHLSKNGIAFQTSKIERILRKTKAAKQHLYNALEVNNLTGFEIKDLNDWIKGYGFKEYFPAYRDAISINDLALLEDSHQVFKIFLRIDKLKRIENFLLSLKGQYIVYPNYKMMGTATGRCTSNSPNVMGIPRIFRSIVIPSRDDFGIIECDYSQMEIGVAAALSCDTNLIKDFNSEDVYIKTSNWLFEKGKTVSRNKAKIMFLGIQYGLSNNTIAKRLEISLTETNEILNQFYARYHNLYEYLKEQERIGAKIGWVKSVSGLKRHRLDRSAPPNYWENNWFKNFPIQSSAASVFKGAISKIYQKFKDTPFNLLIPLYDSVVFEAPLKNIKEITNGVVECMVSSMKDYFPDLQPKVSVNDSNLSYWNAGENNESIDNFLKNPVYDIDIRDKPSSNVNWSEYL